MTLLRFLKRAWLVAAVASGVSLAWPAASQAAASRDGAAHGRKSNPSKKNSTKRKAHKKPRRTASHATRVRLARQTDARTADATMAPPKSTTTLALSPGPAQTADAARSLDKVRRNQIERAASAARRPDMTNRWETVQFLVSGLDEKDYPEAGFWRALALYRHGDVDEADAVRRRCALDPRDVTALDSERAIAATLASHAADQTTVELSGPQGLQQAAYVQTSNAHASSQVHNNTPYTGAGPFTTTPVASN